MWGVYEREDSIHVIPCNKEGLLLPPHEIELLCRCRPEIVETGEDGRLILSHNELH